MSDWRPMHHEEIPPDPKPKPEREEAAREPKAGQGMTMALALNVPPDMMDRMAEIAKVQTGLIEMLGESNGAVQEATTSLIQAHAEFMEVAEGIAQGQQEIVALITAEAANAADRAAEGRQRADEAKAMFDAHKAQGDALMAFLTSTVAMIEDVRKAVTAPRKVTIKRGKDGLAKEAVSTVDG